MKSMLSIDDFQPVKLEDKELFDKHYEKYPIFHSDNVFTTIISWMQYSNYHYTFYKKNLLLYSKIDNNIRLRPPIGKRKKEVFDEVIKLAKKQGSDYPLGMINKDTKEWMEKQYPNIKYKKHRDFFDYIYLADDLAELKGSDYAKIRNRLNKFNRRYEYKLENISEVNFSEIKDFLKRWCLWKDCESDPILEQEKKAIFFSMKHFFDLGLKGIAFRINDQIESIACWEKMNPTTAVVHYEKGTPDFEGIYKAINQETAKIIRKNLTYINRESDMGIPGLRRAKLSYRPHHMIEIYHIAGSDLRV